MAGQSPTIADIRNNLQKRKQIIVDAIIEEVKLTSEEFVGNARSINTYRDQTGNLRSSIGYRIMHDGEQIGQSVQKFNSGGLTLSEKKTNEIKRIESGQDGVTQAGLLLDELTDGTYANVGDISLTVVAGMSYASALESKSIDVLTGSSLIAEARLKKRLKDLTIKLKKVK